MSNEVFFKDNLRFEDRNTEILLLLPQHQHYFKKINYLNKENIDVTKKLKNL